MICFENSDDNLHTFLYCPQSLSLWGQLATLIGFPAISHPSWWAAQRAIWRPIPLIVFWFIWKSRNNRIFQNFKGPFNCILDKVIPFYSSILHISPLQNNLQRVAFDYLHLTCPRAYFDGAAKNGFCACGVYIAMTNDLQYSLYWNGGKGKSNKAKAMALHGLLLFCTFMDIEPINVYGDSKIIIEHVNGKHAIQTDSLTGWLARIAALWKPATFPITHIRRNQNGQADILSKKGLHLPLGKWHLFITSAPLHMIFSPSQYQEYDVNIYRYIIQPNI